MKSPNLDKSKYFSANNEKNSQQYLDGRKILDKLITKGKNLVISDREG